MRCARCVGYRKGGGHIGDVHAYVLGGTNQIAGTHQSCHTYYNI